MKAKKYTLEIEEAKDNLGFNYRIISPEGNIFSHGFRRDTKSGIKKIFGKTINRLNQTLTKGVKWQALGTTGNTKF